MGPVKSRLGGKEGGAGWGRGRTHEEKEGGCGGAEAGVGLWPSGIQRGVGLL